MTNRFLILAGGIIQRHLLASNACLHNIDVDTFKASRSHKHTVGKCVHFLCPESGLSLSTSASRLAEASVANELLIWGSDPNHVRIPRSHTCKVGFVLSHFANLLALSLVFKECQLCFDCNFSLPEQSCISCEQVMKRAVRVLEVLLVAGYTPTRSDQLGLCERLPPGRSFLALFDMLVPGQFSAVSVGFVVEAVKSDLTDVSKLCNQPELVIYWSPECLNGAVFVLWQVSKLHTFCCGCL